MTHPDMPSPVACHGCILARRSEAVARGAADPVSSHGAPLLATERLHALKGLAAMVLLHYDTDHPYWRPLAERIGNRNLMVGRTWDPDVDKSLGITLFEEAGDAEGLRLCDDTVFVACPPQPDCPLCGGTGNLSAAIE